MNPLFMAALAIMLGRRRTCPNCKRRQVVPADKRREAMKCRFCGADLPSNNDFGRTK